MPAILASLKSALLGTSSSPRPKYLVPVGLAMILLGLVLPPLVFRSPVVADPPSAVPVVPTPAAKTAPVDLPAPPSPSGLLIKLIVGMALIGGIAVALARSMKNRPLRPTRNMEILATIAIDSRCMVHLVRSGTRRLLVGLDPSGIKTLTELPASAVPFALTQPGIAYQPLAGEVDLGGPESTSRRD